MMVERQKKAGKKRVQDADLTGKAEEAGRELTVKQKREFIHTTIREMSDANWHGVKALIDKQFTHPRKADELKVLELVLRKGEMESNLDQTNPTLTHGSAKVLIYDLVDRIRGDGVLMMRLHVINRQLASIPPVSREKMRWALHRMPQEHRDHVLLFIPLNPLMEDRERDRKLAHSLFDRDLSDDQLAKQFRLTKHGAKTAVGIILTGLAERPLARKPVSEYLKAVEEIESMKPAEVRDKLRRLSAKKRREIVEAIPAHTWKRREVASKHREIALEYLGGRWSVREFVDVYNQRHPKEKIMQMMADKAIANMLKRVTDEPQLVDKLRYYSGEIPKPQLARLKPPAGVVVVGGPEAEASAARKPVSAHIRALLSNMVGDVRAFCDETGLPEGFLYTLDLEGLARVFSERKIKLRSATAVVAEIMRRQSEAGEVSLTSKGLDKALDALESGGFAVRELKTDPSGPPVHIEELAGKYRSHVLCLNPERALEVSDESLLEFAETKPKVSAEAKIMGQLEQISIMELPETLNAKLKPPTAPIKKTRPAPHVKKHKPASTVEEPAPPVVEEPAPPVVERPAPPVVEKPAPPVVEKPTPPAPQPPEEKPKPPPSKPPEEKPKAPELPPMTKEEFDQMLKEFRGKYKDRVAMMNDVGLSAGGLREPFMELSKAGGVVQEEGEKILAFIPFIRKKPEMLGRIVDHMESSLLGWMEKPPTQEDLPRLALYKTLAFEVGASEGMPKKADEVSKKYTSIGRDYQKFTNNLPDSIWEVYAEIEDKYLNIMKALDPNLEQKIKESIP